MISKDQISELVKQFVKYEADWIKLNDYRSMVAQFQKRVDDRFNNILSLLIEYEARDGDQEAIAQAYKAEGYELTKTFLKHLYLAFDGAGLLQSKSAKVSRKSIIKRASQNDKRVGIKRVEQAIRIQKELDAGHQKTAVKLLKDNAWDHFSALGIIAFDHWDVIAIEDIAHWFSDDFIPWWHTAHDAKIESRKQEQARQDQQQVKSA